MASYCWLDIINLFFYYIFNPLIVYRREARNGCARTLNPGNYNLNLAVILSNKISQVNVRNSKGLTNYQNKTYVFLNFQFQ